MEFHVWRVSSTPTYEKRRVLNAKCWAATSLWNQHADEMLVNICVSVCGGMLYEQGFSSFRCGARRNIFQDTLWERNGEGRFWSSGFKAPFKRESRNVWWAFSLSSQSENQQSPSGFQMWTIPLHFHFLFWTGILYMLLNPIGLTALTLKTMIWFGLGLQCPAPGNPSFPSDSLVTRIYLPFSTCPP